MTIELGREDIQKIVALYFGVNEKVVYVYTDTVYPDGDDEAYEEAKVKIKINMPLDGIEIKNRKE